jgi:nitroreductase
MNEILEFLNSHASVRHFTGDPITVEQENQIVAAAERSPTSSNLHAWSVVSVRAQETKDRLAELCGGQEHVSRSAVFLVFCADMSRLARLARDREYVFHGGSAEGFVVATVDAALAGSRALMAAQAMGFGGVMVGGIRNHPREVCDLLDLPELVYPVFGMSLGKPAKSAKVKPRLPRKGLHFRERYREDQIGPAIVEYDKIIKKQGYLRGREVEPEKYPDFDGEYSWSEHSARRMASENPLIKRPDLKQFLQKQGFFVK